MMRQPQINLINFRKEFNISLASSRGEAKSGGQRLGRLAVSG